MNIIEAYTQKNIGCVVLVLGLPCRASNHHIVAQSLSSAIREKMASSMKITYKQLRTTEDVRRVVADTPCEANAVLILSSDMLLDNVVDVDFTLFIDTPLETIAGRGIDNVFEYKDLWEVHKRKARSQAKNPNRFRFVNDYSSKLITKPEQSDRPSKVLFATWTMLMRMITEALHRQDRGQEPVFERGCPV
jgi:hypothetical protein